MVTTPVFLPGEFHGQRSLVDCTVHAGTKSQTRMSSINKIAEEKLQVNVTRGASHSQPHARFSEIKEKMFLYSNL